MNGAEQRQRATAVQQVEARLEDHATVLVAMAAETKAGFEGVQAGFEAAGNALGVERRQRLDADEKLRAVVFRQVSELATIQMAFVSMRFLQRVKWFLGMDWH